MELKEDLLEFSPYLYIEISYNLAKYPSEAAFQKSIEMLKFQAQHACNSPTFPFD
jgi:hypothetical protein